MTSMVNRSLSYYVVTRVAAALARQLIAVAVGWQMYELTKSTLFLGLVGLAQFIPMVLMTLIAGYAADHFNRKTIAFFSQLVLGLSYLFLALASQLGLINAFYLLGVSFVIGAVNALNGPAMQSILPGIVERSNFARATAITATGFQAATILGPAAGGFLYALGASAVYYVAAAAMVISCAAIPLIKVTHREPIKDPVTVKTLLAGIGYIKDRPVILGSISLDLFAVLFGGATALLPVYAATILMIGSSGLGFLQAAPAVGAILVSFVLAKRTIQRKVGLKMFIAVIIFGLATIIFAVSRSFYLSLIALAVLGGADVVSVVIRSALVQLNTPDNMRGRVSSVNQVFIGTSNQLGEFESGITASLFGTVPAAVIGGVGTIFIAMLWMKLFPSLRKMDTYEELLKQGRK